MTVKYDLDDRLYTLEESDFVTVSSMISYHQRRDKQTHTQTYTHTQRRDHKA